MSCGVFGSWFGSLDAAGRSLFSVRSFPQMEIEQSEVFGLAFAAEGERAADEATENEYPNVIYMTQNIFWHSDESQVTSRSSTGERERRFVCFAKQEGARQGQAEISRNHLITLFLGSRNLRDVFLK